MTQHEKDLNEWLDLCLYAEKLLTNDKQDDYRWLIMRCHTNGRTDLIPLYDKIESGGFMDIFITRAQNYQAGICNIFN